MAIILTEEMIKGAQETERMTGVPSSITLAQIIEESSGKYEGGKSLLALKGNNLFGVKSWSSNPNDYIVMKDGNGQLQTWKKYNSVYDSIVDHAKIISNERYAKLYTDASSVSDYAYALQNGGYAGNSTTYAEKLLTHIEQKNLNQYNLSNTTGSETGTIIGVNNEVIYTEAEDLKWYGDIFKYLLIVMFIVVGVICIIKALDIKIPKKDTPKKVMKE